MINTLYFKTYYSFLKGNLPETEMYYSFLKDEFRKRKDPNVLKPYQLYELKRVREAIRTGNLPRGSWIDDTSLQGPPTQPVAELHQDDLVWKIHQNFRQLKELLQDENLYLYDLEHNCEPYGACDMVYMGKNTVYPVEVKKDRGDHALIGQISKYELYFKFQLHLRHYERVHPITICSSYDRFTLANLKQFRILTLVYKQTEDSLTISKV